MKYAIDFEGYVIIDADSEDDAEQKFLDLLADDDILHVEFGHFYVDEED